MNTGPEWRRALYGVLLGIGYGALVGLLARREDGGRTRRRRWAGGSKA
ncbi:MAG: hypothetical protein ABR548_03485 [Actinomycetota bacterium]|nr:hypothetical protein [Actinomycetota bacterium]